jgi:hypothetical protein
LGLVGQWHVVRLFVGKQQDAAQGGHVIVVMVVVVPGFAGVPYNGLVVF